MDDTYLRDCPSDDEKNPRAGIRGKPNTRRGRRRHSDQLRLDGFAGERDAEITTHARLSAAFEDLHPRVAALLRHAV